MQLLTKEDKVNIIKQFGKSEKNSGNTEAQIALFTRRISHLTEHLKVNKNDKATQRSLINMVGQRKSLLDYLKGKNIELYRQLIKELGIRK